MLRHLRHLGPSPRSRALLSGTSLTVLALMTVPATPACAGMGSPQFFAQVSARLGTGGTGTAATSAGSSASLSIPLVAQAIARRTQADLAKAINAVTLAAQQQAMASLAATAHTSNVLDGSQSSLAAIPNGQLPGLVPCQNNPCGSAGAPVDVTTWQNAALPVQTTNADGSTTVTVTQTAPKAIATWQSFNIGKNTTLNFDQNAGTDQSGNNAWVILNRISDPSASPSQIYGAIRAKGSVYIINPNGVVFDGTSTVDVHALVASTLDIGKVGQTTAQRNAQFLQKGLNITPGLSASQVGADNVAFSELGAASTVLDDTSTAGIDVAAGARITSTVFPSDNPGSVILLGANVSNAGQIVSPAGQVILGAGRAFAFLENTTVKQSAGVNYLGLVPVTQPNFLLPGTVTAGDAVEQGRAWHGTVTATNSAGGLIETNRGNITLMGSDVENDGVLAATTSITRNGSIVLQGAKSANFGANATALILPEENGETIPLGQATGTTVSAPYIQIQGTELSSQQTLAAQSGLGTVTLGAGSSIVAPGATIGVFAGNAVQLGTNSTIDAAGLTTGALVDQAGTQVSALPMSTNFITFKPLGPELANSPLQRSGVLRGQSITVDARVSGVSANGIAWVGTPLANATGYVNTEVTEGINQILAKGGSVTVATAASINPIAGQLLDSVVLRPGSVIDVSGGYVSYAGGLNTTTNLTGTDGKTYSISNADPNVTYTGIAGSYSFDHAHWGITDSYYGNFSSVGSASYEPGYISGSPAGSIILFADSVEADGQIYGQTSAGPLQLTSGTIPTSGSLFINSGSPGGSGNQALAVLSGQATITPQWVLLQKRVADTIAPGSLVSQTVATTIFADYPLSGLLDKLGAQGPTDQNDPLDRADIVILSTDMLDAGGFAKIALAGTTLVSADANLTVANGSLGAASPGQFLGGGGSITVVGPAIDVEGALSAASGTISLSTNGVGNPFLPSDSAAITIGADALLDVRGRWTNDSGTTAGTSLGANNVNGGAISLQTKARQTTVGTTVVDTTGSIVIQTPASGAGPQLLASSGGYVGINGKLSAVSGVATVPKGLGGSITLATYVGGYTQASLGNPAPVGPLTAGLSLDPARSLSAFGLAGGGTLKIAVGPSIVIADSATIPSGSLISSANGVLIIGSSFFNNSGSSYQNPFGTIDLESDSGAVIVAGDNTISSGAVIPWTLHLTQSTFQSLPALASIPTYSSFGKSTPLTLVSNTAGTPTTFTLTAAPLAQFQSAVTNLTLGPAQGDSEFYPLAGPVSGSIAASGSVEAIYSATPGSTVLEQGVTIEADANRNTGATITLKSTFLTEIDGTILDPAGSVVLQSSGLSFTGSTKAVVDGRVVGNGVVTLAAGSLVNVAGAVVADSVDMTRLPNGVSYTPTNVLPGGTVTLRATGSNAQTGAANSFGYILQLSGSTIDIGGADASVDMLTPALGGGQTVAAQELYSDAGAVTLNATAAAMNGEILARGGGGILGSTAANGILSVTSGLPADILINPLGLLADGNSATNATSADFLNGTDSNTYIVLSSEAIDRSRFDDVNIGLVDQNGTVDDINSITFAGTVVLNSRRSMLLAGPITEADSGSSVSIKTGYLTLTTTDRNYTNLATARNGTFSATVLDLVLERGLIDAASVSLSATADAVVESIIGNRTQNFDNGGLVTSGDLSIQAARLYPMGGTAGVIQSLGASGSGGHVNILEAVAGSDTSLPLVAGGLLYVLGDTINQHGVVMAPGGSIVFGNASGAQSFFFDGSSATSPKVTPASKVTFSAGSTTSVSLGDTNLPYGGTVDQVSWYYADSTRSETSLSAPPAKSISADALSISIDGSSTKLNSATVDIAGGGNLYASEFIAGNGGSANVLSSDSTYTATSFLPSILGNIALYNSLGSTTSASRTYAANLNSTSQVYAIVPLRENPTIAPSDLDFSTYVSPSTNPGTGFGNSAPANGLAIKLSGVSGLPDGTYTLLPAPYATLPGAYRVVIVPGSTNFQSTQNTTLPDGSQVVSARVTTALSPSVTAKEISSQPIAVELQSSKVWGLYSNIATTEANSFFSSQSKASTVAPRLPQDAGTLQFQAIVSLNLAGTLLGSAPAGLGSIVEITAENLQVLASDRSAEATHGYVVVDATQLTDLGAGNLLLGGTETTGSTGEIITAKSFNVEITSDAANPLSAPEILIVTRGDHAGTDRAPAKGLSVDPDAVIEANGVVSGTTAPRTITIYGTPSASVDANGHVTPAYSDGAFLAVTNGSTITLNRAYLPKPTGNASPLGTAAIGAGSIIRGGNDLVIDASDGSNPSTIDPTAQLSASNVTLSGTAISLGDLGEYGLIVPDAVVSQLLAATTLTLHSVGGGNGASSGNGIGDIEFAGVTSLDLTAANSILTLDATALTIDSAVVTTDESYKISLGASTVNLADTNGVGAFSPTSNPAILAISAGTINFGSGTNGLAFDQFDQVALSATSLIAAQGTLAVLAADAAVTITTPLILAGSGSSFSLATTGSLAVVGTGEAAPSTGSALGGNIGLQGGSVVLDTAMTAPSGNITIISTSSDLTLGNNAKLSAAGYQQVFFDTVKYASGGTIKLTAEDGNLVLANGSSVAADAAAAGGSAGALDLSAPLGNIQISGQFSARAPTVGSGTGGSLSIAEQDAVDLTALAAQIAKGGFSAAVSIATQQGDLILSDSAIYAAAITLEAQGGHVIVRSGSTLDASGTTGGSITLLGNDGVDIEGTLRARGSRATTAGGSVSIGAAGIKDASHPLNTLYGYENIISSGGVSLGAGAFIDVSGGTVAGDTGGTVKISVPLLESGTVQLVVTPGATITGSYRTVLDGYAVWSTGDNILQSNAALRFDGIVDPAGTDAAAGTGNHAAFYGTTLINFVENYPVALHLPASLGTVHFQPGIELINDQAGINNGDITVASAWNLGAGGYGSTGNVSLFYRTPSGEPGTLSLRAKGNVNVNADLTDGFFQTQNSLSANYQNILGNIYLENSGTGNILALAPAGNSTQSIYVTPLYAPQAPYDTTDTVYTADYAAYRTSYQLRFDSPTNTSGYARAWSLYQQDLSQVTYTNPATDPAPDDVTLVLPTAPQPGNFSTYARYLTAYQSVYVRGYTRALNRYAAAITDVFQPPPAPAAPIPPSAGDGSTGGSEYLAYATAYQTVYSAAYRGYLGTVNGLVGSYSYSATNMDGSDRVLEAPTAPTAPVPWGSEIGIVTGVYSAANSAAIYGANGISPNATTNNPDPVLSASLVPATAVAAASPTGGGAHAISQGSWSFQITGGADTANVNPLALQAITNFTVDPTSANYTTGTVTLDGHSSYQLALSVQTAILASDPTLKQVKLAALVPTVIRTGTGTIDVAAATNIVLADTAAPGTIYTAGVQTTLPGSEYSAVNGGTAINGLGSVASLSGTGGSGFFGDGTGSTTIGNPAGFDAPSFGNSFVLTAPTLFAVTDPAYPDGGGDVTLTAQNDIIGVLSTAATAANNSNAASGYLDQFWSNWLLTRSSPIAGGTAYSFNADLGLYNPNVTRPNTTNPSAGSDLTDGQTTWWINFGSFDQGVAALGGGNVTVTAGHDIRQFSASTASTGRVSGGLDASSPPTLHVTGGGNLTVIAGNDILSGAYYVALGTGTIRAGGSIGPDSANWSYKYKDTLATPASNITIAPSVILGIGDSQVSVSATGSVNIGDVVNPTEIKTGVSLVVGDDYIANHGGASSLLLTNNTEFTFATAQFNTMSPASSISVASIGGAVDFLTLPTGSANKLYQTNYRLLPATVAITAYRGKIAVDSSFDMTNSTNGSLLLDAYTNLRLVGPDNQLGASATATLPNTSAEGAIATFQTKNVQTIATVNPVPGLVDTQFDPFNPVADYASNGNEPFVQTASAQYLLLHTDGSTAAQFYALNGDITNGVVISDPAAVPKTSLPIPILTDLPITIEAGQDILNLQLYAQNTQSTDVTNIIAGRDISYDLPATNLNVTGANTNGLNLIELAGPGSLVLEAGRNLGPFPNNFNIGPSGIETTGAYDWTSSTINPLLDSVGASIAAYAGVANGINSAAEIASYLNPASASFDSFLNVSYAVEYAPQLLVYLRQLGPQYSGLTEQAAFAAFSALSGQQQQVFLNQVFFNQLQTTQSAPDILTELLAFETSRNLLGYTMAQVYGLFENGSSTAGQQLLTDAYTVFANLAPAEQQSFATEIATDTSTQAPNIWHTYALFEGLKASERNAYVTGTSPSTDLTYIEALAPDQRQALVHGIGAAALLEIPSVWNTPGYARGYQMINTVFPGANGYTQNRSAGGLGAAPGTLVETGKIDLRSATIQTQHGGGIQIFAPGGSVLLGSSAARTIYNQPGSTGLLTFQGGAIDVFADQSLIVNQSRILTEEGGDVLTWSSNADILAGSGAKTSADFPPYTVLYDTDGLQSLNPAGLVTGAGIGALVTVNNQDPTQSNDYFMTPVGTVDAGDAGLRAAGNLVVAAAHVANAGNISVGGKSSGVPTVAAVNVGALASAGSAAAGAAHAADSGGFNKKSNGASGQSVITIDVLGFGGGDGANDQSDEERKKKAGA